MMSAAIHLTANCRRVALVFALLVATTIVLASCGPDKEKEREIGIVRHDPPATDRDKLLLIRQLPLGADYREVKSCFPRSGPMMASTTDHTMADSELVVSVKMMEHDASLRFAFQKHILSSYSFDVSMLDSVTASDLNSKVQEFYTMAFGNFHEFVETDKHVSTWSEGETEIQVVTRRAKDGFQIFWEFRKSPKPGRPV